MSFFPRQGEYYEDFADGERLRRITEELPAGAAALSSVLFFDEINLDQKGYKTGDGIIIMGGFFNQKARESLFSKYSLGTLPSVEVPSADKKRMSYFRFSRLLRARCHAAILACYTEFNNAGGAMLKLQYNGRLLYFPRAVILSYLVLSWRQRVCFDLGLRAVRSTLFDARTRPRMTAQCTMSMAISNGL